MNFYKFDNSSESESSNNRWYSVNIDIVEDKTENQNNIGNEQDQKIKPREN